MAETASTDPAFLATVERWIADQSEVLVAFRYSRAAGSKDFAIYETFAAFHRGVARLPAETSVIVFRGRHLPLRGIIDADLREAACRLIPEGTEYLIVRLPLLERGPSHRASDTRTDLAEDLAFWDGERVALGPFPPWDREPEEAVEAIVPDADGVARRGIY